MGCSASTLDSEQSVSRCKNRKHYIKLAVQQRHAFAAAHAAYIMSLKNTGAAIRQFGEGESKDPQVLTEIPSNTPNPQYFPPPLPHFLAPSPSVQPSPISRAVSMPPLRSPSAAAGAKKNSPFQTVTSSPNNPNPNSKLSSTRNLGPSPVRTSSLSPHGPLLEEEGEGEADDADALQKKSYAVDAKPPPPPPSSVTTPPPPPPPPKASPWEYLSVFPSAMESEDLDKGHDRKDLKENSDQVNGSTQTAEAHEQPNADLMIGTPPQTPQAVNNKSTIQGSGKDLGYILRELDDRFLAAFESGKGVAKLLEARRTHYHSNFADVNDSLDHSKRVLRVMSWGRNPKLPLTNGEIMDIYQDKEIESHASTLDKLLAWEKKLHDEVKAGELIRIELERKSAQLKSQKKREETGITISKTKSAVKSLQTRYLVEIQAVDAASSEVDKLRDECLYSQLVDLVDELMTMWNCMLKCHQEQYQLIENMGNLDNSYAPSCTNDFHFDNTLQLESEINLWHQNFDKLLSTQKEYMDAVYHWLRLHVIQIESDSKDAPGSPQKMSPPPVYYLCRAWFSTLDQLPGNVTLHALRAFSSLIHELTVQQTEELKLKKKLEGLRKELEKKEQNLRVQEAKYNERRALGPSSTGGTEEEAQQNGNPMRERERMLQLLRETVESEREKYEQMCFKSGTMTLSSLEKGLPPVLNAIRDFAASCSKYYTELHTLTSLADEEEEEDDDEDASPPLQISYD